MLLLWSVQGYALRAGLVAIMCFSVWEVYGAFRARGERPLRFPGMLFALAAMPLYLYSGRGASVFAPLIAVCTMLAMAVIVVRGGEIDYGAAAFSVLPILYPGLPIALLFPLQDLSTPLLSSVALGHAFLIALMSDLFAYEIGSKFGRRPLSTRLSPKKTVEGALGGMAASVIFAMLVPFVAKLIVLYVPIVRGYDVPLPPYWQCAILGLVGGAAAQIGDLTASLIKRYSGVKDFGTIFPGHGGMMDRMDSVLFSGVVAYIYYLFIYVA
jgi:phosphatidate cytidylyltransferase